MIIFKSTGKVNIENKVVATTNTDAYSLFMLKLSANMEVIAAAGIEARMITEFETIVLSFINWDMKYKIIGIMISLAVRP